MLEPLLADEHWGLSPGLWRLAAAMAEKRGLPLQSADDLDRALDLEYADLTDEVDLKRLRTVYRELLERYGDAAEGVADTAVGERQRLVGRVVRAADRWRSLDPEVGDACCLAAAALAKLGASDLAWDYVTSPLAAASEVSIPWNDRGREYHRQGLYELAQRAYALAFEADPANAQILWDRAQALIESGRRSDAQLLLEEIASGTWDAKYEAICRQAKRVSRRN